LKDPVHTGAGEHAIGAGIGIALAPTDGSDAETLLRKADVALYRAKAVGPSALRFLEEEMDHHIRERDILERDLRAAISARKLEVIYQPRIDLKTGAIISFEPTARWMHGQYGELDTARLVAIAENMGLVQTLVDDLLRTACRDAATWGGNVTLSFGIPPALLKDDTFGLRIVAILGDSGLPASRLELEITESALVADLESAKRVLGDIHETGVKIDLNNFGTGYSSLYHLRNFKLDTIKIDRIFVQAMAENPESAAIVRALVGLGSGLGLMVAAEGVQNERQQTMLVNEGCQQGQGFLFSQAVTADEAWALLKASPGAAHVSR
jgi:predicted signal transduction protein with EAL and GGDEF domain